VKGGKEVALPPVPPTPSLSLKPLLESLICKDSVTPPTLLPPLGHNTDSMPDRQPTTNPWTEPFKMAAGCLKEFHSFSYP